MTGLGNMSNNGGVTIGKSLAELIPAVGQGPPGHDHDRQGEPDAR